MTKGRPLTSNPRAATSVQMRNRTSPSLNAARLRLRSSMDRDPPSTTQLYGFSGPLSALPRNFPPPPHWFKKVSTLSQSKLVRQKMRHWLIACASMSRFRTCGLRCLIACDRLALERVSVTSSCLCALSVGGFGYASFPESFPEASGAEPSS